MEENSIRFEDIPNAITGVLKKLSSLEDKIDGIYELVQSEKEETWFTVAELCAYLPTHPVEPYHILLDKQSGNTVSQERQTHHVPQI